MKITGKRVKNAWREYKADPEVPIPSSLKEYARRRAMHTSDARVWLERKSGTVS